MSFAMFCMQFISSVRCTRAAGNHKFLNQQQEKVSSKQTMLNHLMTNNTHTHHFSSQRAHTPTRKETNCCFIFSTFCWLIHRSLLYRTLAGILVSHRQRGKMQVAAHSLSAPTEVSAPKCGNAFFVPSRRARRLYSSCSRLNVVQAALIYILEKWDSL